MGNIGKVPPQATDLEEAVIGAMLNNRSCADTAFEILKPEHFYKDNHQAIFEAASSLYLKNEPVDAITVTEKLRQLGKLEIAGGAYAIILLSDNTTGMASIGFNCRIILQYFFKREIIRISMESCSQAYEDTSDVFDLVDKMYQCYDLISNEIGRSIDSVGDIFRERIKAYEEKVNNGITGLPSGFIDLDRITAGWQPTDLIIVAGRPAMGKTAFSLGLARNPAIDFNKPVAFFSLEMSKEQLVDRLVSSETEIESEVIRKRSLSEHDWARIGNKSNMILDAPLYIDDTPALTIRQFRTKAKKLKKDHDIQLIVIDYLQLMQGEREKGVTSNREQEIGGISRALKAVAKELNIPVIALSQLSRAVESRPGNDRRPRLSDLRESGAIEQDADMVIFLYRPEYYGITEDANGSSTLGIGEVIIAKHRNGPTDTALLRFIGKYTKFVDLEQNRGFGENNFSNQFPVQKPHPFVIKPNLAWDGGSNSDDDMPF